MSIATRFILTAALFGTIGFIMGISMGMSRDFSMTPVHGHLNLIGWLSMAVFGIVYKLYPPMAADSLAKIHYWLVTVGVVVMMVSLALLIKGVASIALILVLGEVMVVLSMLLFLFIVWKHRSAA